MNDIEKRAEVDGKLGVAYGSWAVIVFVVIVFVVAAGLFWTSLFWGDGPGTVGGGPIFTEPSGNTYVPPPARTDMENNPNAKM